MMRIGKLIILCLKMGYWKFSTCITQVLQLIISKSFGFDITQNFIRIKYEVWFLNCVVKTQKYFLKASNRKDKY